MINIYVGNLPYSVKSEELREAFEAYGDVASAEVIFDRRTKRSRGYGFVEMNNDDDAREAISSLNGSDFQGRELRVDESQAKEQKPERGNGGGNGRPRTGNTTRQQPGEQPPASGGLFGFVKKLFG
jgi:RNA recognition motif-containing protein